jgi:hypothetical protein
VSPCGGGSTAGVEVEDGLVATVVLADSFAGVATGVLDAASAIGVEDVEA